MKSNYTLFLAIVFLLSGCKKEHEIVHEEIDLNNTNWAIHQTQEIPVRANGNLPTLHFKDGVMGVGTNCNIAFSEYESTGNTIKFRGLSTTYKYCQDMQIEDYFGTKIRSISSYIYNDGKLYLYIGERIIGSFKRLPE